MGGDTQLSLAVHEGVVPFEWTLSGVVVVDASYIVRGIGVLHEIVQVLTKSAWTGFE